MCLETRRKVSIVGLWSARSTAAREDVVMMGGDEIVRASGFFQPQ